MKSTSKQLSSVIIAGVVRKKKGRGLFIPKKDAFSAENGERPARSGLCLHVCGAEWSVLLQDTALLLHQKNAVYFSFLLQVVFGRVLVRDGRRPPVSAVALETGPCQVRCRSCCRVCGGNESRMVLDGVTSRPFYRSEPPRSAQETWFPPGGKAVPSIVPATSSLAPAEEEVDTLVLWSDKPETWEDHTRLQHFPPGLDGKYAWSPAQLNSYSSRLKQMTGSTDIFQVPFPQI